MTTLETVRGYHDAWTTNDIEGAGRYLAPDLETEVPINSYESASDFLEAVAQFGRLVRKVDLLAEFVHENEALLLYDMDVDSIGTMRIAEHFTVADGRITRIRHVHDTAALLAAGFAAQP